MSNLSHGRIENPSRAPSVLVAVDGSVKQLSSKGVTAVNGHAAIRTIFEAPNRCAGEHGFGELLSLHKTTWPAPQRDKRPSSAGILAQLSSAADYEALRNSSVGRKRHVIAVGGGAHDGDVGVLGGDQPPELAPRTVR